MEMLLHVYTELHNWMCKPICLGTSSIPEINIKVVRIQLQDNRPRRNKMMRPLNAEAEFGTFIIVSDLKVHIAVT